MTDDEARGVLADTSSEVEALISLAQGWPAVLALAAMSGTAPPDLVAAPHLYNFFAEEIYRRVDRRARRALREMALYDVAGRRLALAGVRPEEAKRLIRVSVECGFVTVSPDESLEMHPLLMSFLERKLREESRGKLNELLGRVARTLMKHELWDEAFSVIDRFGETDLLTELIESSLDPLLSSGRSATLRNWMKNAPQTAPPVRLAAAELAFREGRFHESETLASLAARDALENGELKARAYIAAGRAAHAASREEEAFRSYQRAHEATNSLELRRIAIHGELAAAIELELEGRAVELLESLGPAESLEPHDRVVYEDRKMNLESHFGISSGLEGGRAGRQLLGLVGDPVARSSLRNVLGYALAVGGYYAEALEVTQEQLDEAERFRLDFVLPYALIVRALANGGLREYALADESLSEADERASLVGDPTARHIIQAVRTRLFTAQGAFELALSKPLPWSEALPKAIYAELCSAYAVALAGHGYTERSRQLADISENHSISGDARIGAACARSIVALRNSAYDEGCHEAQLALSRATCAGSIEPFVTAYRGCPEIVVSLMTDPNSHSDLARILSLAGDAALMGQQALPDHSILGLSRREKEVLALIARGHSNRQIGEVLFISPATAKVHVRHIFEKLGVRSRAEAAMRATQLPR